MANSDWNETVWTSVFDALLNPASFTSRLPLAELRAQLLATILAPKTHEARALKVQLCAQNMMLFEMNQ